VAIDTYDELVEEIASTLNRADLTDDIPGFIALAEERHRDDVRIREMLTRSTVQITARYMDMPTGFIEMKRLRAMATTTADPWNVQQVTPDEITDKRQRAVRLGTYFVLPSARPRNLPNYYAVESQLEFDIDPSEFDDDEPYAEFLYYDSRKVAALSASNASNVILVKAPGLYLYGALVHSAPFLLDDERIATWETAYQERLAKVNATDRKRAGSLVSRVVGSTP
jgi:hypothetical protein